MKTDDLKNALYKLALLLRDNSDYINYDPTLTNKEIEDSTIEENLNNIYIMCPDYPVRKIKYYPSVCIWIKNFKMIPRISEDIVEVNDNGDGSGLFWESSSYYDVNLCISILTSTIEEKNLIFNDINDYIMANCAYKVYGDDSLEANNFAMIDKSNYVVIDSNDRPLRRDLNFRIIITKFSESTLYYANQILNDIEANESIIIDPEDYGPTDPDVSFSITSTSTGIESTITKN